MENIAADFTKSHNRISVEKYEPFLFHILTHEWIRYYYTLSQYTRERARECEWVSVSEWVRMGTIYIVSSDSLSLFMSFISFPLYQPVLHLALKDPILSPLLMSHILHGTAASSSLKKEIKSASGKEGVTKADRRVSTLECKTLYEQSPWI
jgi:hypothetical protein